MVKLASMYHLANADSSTLRMPTEDGHAIALREGGNDRPFLSFTKAPYVIAEPFNSYEKEWF